MKTSISKINPILNDRSKSFTVEATFTKEPPILYPFLTVEANIVIHTKDRALTVRSYLVSDSMVLLENNKPVKVTTGLKDYLKVEIISGISARIILSNLKIELLITL